MKTLFAKTQYELSGHISIEKTHWTASVPTYRLDIVPTDYTREMNIDQLILLRDEISALIEMQ